ncbi:hypothetical protein AUR64_13900 [Haloprofundus marisrubri]|uniref:DUF1508 domain-containing protein n=1 Tax=Haloprofundus marisrubri TaxID=1514971 RepID=A0A0W1R7C1_9EURY|nr:HVO_2922 family protein [Haloprofundus marisrubri]KTG08900.1 hypothetical protein AUR64_13900 [Haloprofundus marisrubri]
MSDPRVHVSVSVVADGERIGQFDSDTEPEAVDSAPAEPSEPEPTSPDVEAESADIETSISAGADDTADTADTADTGDTGDTADTDDTTNAADSDPPAAATFELYRDRANEWRWRLRHRNGNIIADGGEGYSSKSAAKNGIESVKKNAAGASVETR